MSVPPTEVRIQVTDVLPDGASCFVDETAPLLMSEGPLRSGARAPAVSMSFRWTPSDFDFDFHPSPRKRLVIVTSGALEITVGSGESRVFRPGDILSLRDTWGQGHRSCAIDGPFTSAFIALDEDVLLDRRTPLGAAAGGVEFLHNQETDDGVSYVTRKTLPYVYGGPEGMVTEEFPIKAFRYIWAAGDLDYAWHPAPERQIVLVLSGGLTMEYGDGAHADVPAGGFLVGEDTDGRGHVTRALDGAARLSVFAVLGADARF